ncbi:MULTISPECIES: MetQ/NlpA family ABC transporter substrate-binding protein [Rhizobium/Agrobacterium group]|uniref:MetQ/NlpA family ABC transporter substrate-binding protein n=1 Tax=Neorhizobium petrolearium TaxID=515361 RepID=A0ABY8MBB2_9HYPH|nr:MULTISPECIES: MetQ/NlpA family ABC transporter substrate-binding protein [Rhizobium/Agrobacterium group]KGD99658.1 dioxygenase [Rhizobium sp. YS-1r]MCC2613498.1 MetQ/NlpA family ABC transporter substrate-binding protein [Neorhizobium petrolearium]WGI71821.1 MetQ/NlpA family ABC transporter substrate-binding protein [Neorhizobium petrolearium]
MRKFIIAAAFAALAAAPALAETIKIGVTPGPHAQIMEKVKEVAAGKGLDIDILEFSDYVVPNQALADGELNANSFQHQPYLDNQVADRKFDLVSVAQTVNFPMGVYSKKVKSLDELKDGATVAIPNDPTNGGRALLILADQGLIKVDAAKGLKIGPADVTENPKNIEFAELDAAQLPRSLDDVDASVINTNYALEAGLNPKTDPIAREGEKAPYINVIAVSAKDKDAAWVKTLIEAYHSDSVKDFVNTQFKGAVVAAW